MKNKSWVTILIIICGLFLTACQAGPLAGLNNAQETPRDIPTPAAGLAVMTGKALQDDGSPFADTPIRLAQIYRQGDQGAFIIDAAHSPSAMSDIEGFFNIVNIPPGEFLIVVGWLEDNNYRIYQSKAGEPYTYQLTADQTLDVGVIKVIKVP